MMRKKIIIAASAVVLVMLYCAYVCIAPIDTSNGALTANVRPGDNHRTVIAQFENNLNAGQKAVLTALFLITNYDKNPHPGHYVINDGDNVISAFRTIRGGRQTPIKITIPVVRTMKDLAEYLDKKLMLSGSDFLSTVLDTTMLAENGVDSANVYCMFIPNTYEVYWNVEANHLLYIMKKGVKVFWNEERLRKAAAIPLTPNEVYTLASIVSEETANVGEMPDVAGMYINRLRSNMPLQADPTVKFALHDFSLRRIYHNHLTVDSPYNTYRYEGLPPGPIRIAPIAAIDAVLNYTHHDYLYMCAKEDFSGCHRFARTYAEHLKNAALYAKALNERGIK